jgi:uncharacterized protein (TIGR03067 family)
MTAKKSDLDKLQGAWNIVSLEMEGQKYPAGGSRIVIQGGRFTSLNMGAEYEGAVTVDESASPRTFTLAFDKGPEAGNEALGIYELSGDAWKICLALAGKKRPTEFAAKPGTGHALELLERDKGSARQLPTADAKAAPVAGLEGEWKMISCLQDGKAMDAGFVKSASREFRGNTTTLSVGDRPMTKSRFFADAKAGSIEYPDLRQHGIYKVTGDKLQTCLVTEGQTRPADFSAAPGDGRLVSEWKRV